MSRWETSESLTGTTRKSRPSRRSKDLFASPCRMRANIVDARRSTIPDRSTSSIHSAPPSNESIHCRGVSSTTKRVRSASWRPTIPCRLFRRLIRSKRPSSLSVPEMLYIPGRPVNWCMNQSRCCANDNGSGPFRGCTPMCSVELAAAFACLNPGDFGGAFLNQPDGSADGARVQSLFCRPIR